MVAMTMPSLRRRPILGPRRQQPLYTKDKTSPLLGRPFVSSRQTSPRDGDSRSRAIADTSKPSSTRQLRSTTPPLSDHSLSSASDHSFPTSHHTPNGILRRFAQLNCGVKALDDDHDDMFLQNWMSQSETATARGEQAILDHKEVLEETLNTTASSSSSAADIIINIPKADSASSAAFFTDDESSTSSGLQMRTMDAESCSLSGDDDDYNYDSFSVGDDDSRIGIRPFPSRAPSSEEALSPPICSHSGLKQTKSTVEDELWSAFQMNVRMDSQLNEIFGKQETGKPKYMKAAGRARRATIKEIADHCQKTDKTDAMTLFLAPHHQPDEPLKEVRTSRAVHGALPRLKIAASLPVSPTETANSLLVDPPKLERRHSLRHLNADYTDHEPELIFVSNHGYQREGANWPTRPVHRSKESYRSSSPGMEPASQPSKLCNSASRDCRQPSRRTADVYRSRSPPPIAPQASDGSLGVPLGDYETTASALIRQRFQQSSSLDCIVPRRVMPPRSPWATTGRASAGTPPLSRRPAASTQVVSLSERLKHDDNVLHTSHKVRWNDALLASDAGSSTFSHQLPPKARSDTGIPRSIYRAKSSHHVAVTSDSVVATNGNGLVQISSKGDDSIVAEYKYRAMARSIVRKSWHKSTVAAASMDEMHASKSATTCQSLVAVQDESTASDTSGVTFTSIKDLIGKFDAQAKRNAGVALPRESRPRERSGGDCDHLHLLLPLGKPESSSKASLVVSHSASEGGSVAGRSETGSQSEENAARSGFFWRSHPQPLANPMKSNVYQPQKIALSASHGSSADGMTAETETTRGTTSEDERHAEPSRRSRWETARAH
jgi:hypothetical protein